MMKSILKTTLALLPAVFLLVGCGSTADVEGEGDQPPAATTGQGADASAADQQAATAQSMEPPAPLDPFEDPNNPLSQSVVYFEFDSSAIADSALPIIQAHAQYLASNSNVNFTLEGHADERGTREYNLALGERRADAVRRMLIANGVSPAQIKVVSYGEERPAVMGHDDDAWSQNRRAEFVYANR